MVSRECGLTCSPGTWEALRLHLDMLKIDRAEFIRELRRRGIGTSVHFIPIPLHPFFSQLPLARYACPRALARAGSAPA